MIVLTNKLLKNKKKFIKEITKEKEAITASLESQNSTLKYIENLINSTPAIEDADINKQLNNLKTCLVLSKNNITLLNSTLALLDNLSISYNKNLKQEINNFNTILSENSDIISQNDIQVQNILNTSLSNCESNSCNTEKDSTLVSNSCVNSSTEETTNVDDLSIIENEPSVPQNNIIENTLIISEQQGKIFLPYTLETLNNKLNNTQNSYSDIEDIIQKDYTLPINMFKIPSISRFREAFSLIRNKEKASIKKAFELAIELLFNYNLHPAIISACRNLDELDIYLDYLENNETHKFKCFNIVFEIPPAIV